MDVEAIGGTLLGANWLTNPPHSIPIRLTPRKWISRLSGSIFSCFLGQSLEVCIFVYQNKIKYFSYSPRFHSPRTMMSCAKAPLMLIPSLVLQGRWPPRILDCCITAESSPLYCSSQRTYSRHNSFSTRGHFVLLMKNDLIANILHGNS